jgi:prevent-host-death family protein
MDKRVSMSKLKAHCSELVERVKKRREAVVITRRGRPVAELVPLAEEPASLFGFAKGAITVKGDLIAPMDAEWDASG